jgi:hypothetical protein
MARRSGGSSTGNTENCSAGKLAGIPLQQLIVRMVASGEQERHILRKMRENVVFQVVWTQVPALCLEMTERGRTATPAILPGV